MLYADVPKDVINQLLTIRSMGLGEAAGAEILGVIPDCMWVFGTSHAKSARPFDKNVMRLLSSEGAPELMLLASPEDYVIYGLAMRMSQEGAGRIMRRVNENGGACCMEGVEVEGWQVYEA